MAMTMRVTGKWGCVRSVECNLKPRSSRLLLSLGRVVLPPAGALHVPGLSLLPTWTDEKGYGRAGRVRCASQPLVEDLAANSDELTVYRDSALEVIAMQYLTTRIARLGNVKTKLTGYDGFVDVSKKLVHGLPAKTQRDIVRDVLHAAVPAWVLACFYSVPKTKWVKEFHAKMTTVCFAWLVGNCEVREKEIDGVLMKSTVYIKKCRYLENSKCVGLCVNLCKNPTEEFIGKQFGMPLTMNPNFEDMSCEMIFGIKPPPPDEDAAYQRSCYSLCQLAKTKPRGA